MQGSLARFAKVFASPEIYKKVEAMLEEQVRPVLKMDGGDIELNDIVDGVMIVTLSGMCSGCPGRKSTMEQGILGCIQEDVPEIIGIREKMDFEEL